MKRELVLMIWLLAAVCVKAQQGPGQAFSKSCAFEYDLQCEKAITVLLELKPDSYEVNLHPGWLYANKYLIKALEYNSQPEEVKALLKKT